MLGGLEVQGPWGPVPVMAAIVGPKACTHSLIPETGLRTKTGTAALMLHNRLSKNN